MEENKLNYEEIQELMDKINKAMNMSENKEKVIAKEKTELYDETRPLAIEEKKRKIEKLEEEKIEFDEMTSNSVILINEQIKNAKKELQEKQLKMYVNAYEKTKRIEEKLNSIKSKNFSEEKVQWAEKGAKKAKEKIEKELKEFQEKFLEQISNLRKHERELQKYANILGIEDRLNEDKEENKTQEDVSSEMKEKVEEVAPKKEEDKEEDKTQEDVSSEIKEKVEEVAPKKEEDKEENIVNLPYNSMSRRVPQQKMEKTAKKEDKAKDKSDKIEEKFKLKEVGFRFKDNGRGKPVYYTIMQNEITGELKEEEYNAYKYPSKLSLNQVLNLEKIGIINPQEIYDQGLVKVLKEVEKKYNTESYEKKYMKSVKDLNSKNRGFDVHYNLHNTRIHLFKERKKMKDIKYIAYNGWIEGIYNYNIEPTMLEKIKELVNYYKVKRLAKREENNRVIEEGTISSNDEPKKSNEEQFREGIAKLSERKEKIKEQDNFIYDWEDFLKVFDESKETNDEANKPKEDKKEIEL